MKQLIHHTGSIALVIAAALFSCNESEETTDIGHSYYPVELGRYYIYDVDSIYADCKFNVRDSVHFQVKEVYDTLFYDGTGNLAVRIERYRRSSPAQSWSITDVWHTDTLPTRAERTEENIKYVKLVFPVAEGTEWDGNAYNFIDDWDSDYRYGEIDVPWTVGPLQFDSTVSVIQKDDEDLLEKQYFIERYARNVGLVLKTSINIKGIVDQSEPGAVDCDELLPYLPWNTVPIMERIASGYVVNQRLIEFGFE